MKTTFSLCLVLAVVFGSTNGSTNPLDLGYSDTCTRPTTNTVCDIDYDVPSSVAHPKIVAIKESIINSSKTTGETSSCTGSIRNVQCSRHFPRCHTQQSRVAVIYEKEACSQVEETCSEQVMESGSCDFTVNATHGVCKKVSDFVEERNQPLTACNSIMFINPLWYVTEWMFDYLRNLDEELEAASGDLRDLINNEVCFQMFINFRCQSVGRCWDQGRRIEFSANATKSKCEQVKNCLTSASYQILENQLLCNLWPEQEAPNTPETPITPTTMAPPTSIAINNTEPTTNFEPSSAQQPLPAVCAVSIMLFVMLLGMLL